MADGRHNYRFLLIQPFHLPPTSRYLLREVEGTKDARMVNYKDVAHLLEDVEWDLDPGPLAPYGDWPVETREEFCLVAAGRLPVKDREDGRAREEVDGGEAHERAANPDPVAPAAEGRERGGGPSDRHRGHSRSGRDPGRRRGRSRRCARVSRRTDGSAAGASRVHRRGEAHRS